MKELLSDVLGSYMQATSTGATRLATLSNVPRKTINHWLSGHVLRPHRWQPLLQVALALHLTEAQTDRLFLAAGHEAVRKLRAHAQGDDLRLLSSLNGVAPASEPAPFRAPQDLTTFVGRDDAIAILRTALLRTGQAVIYGLRGMGGVGKTTLATHLAYLLKDEFPDGVLWARLDTSDTLSILLSFADAFGKDVSQYRDIESRAMVVRGVLAHKRILIVLDNAETGAQVLPLLPPSGSHCAVLVTTRNDLAPTDGWPYYELGSFAAQSGESLRLFENFIGHARAKRHHVALQKMADLLGHLPLALAMTGGQLAVALRSSTSAQETQVVNAMLHDLQQEDARLSYLRRDHYSVQVSFNLSYDKLPKPVQLFFAQLGVFGGLDFGIEAAASVSNIDIATAQDYFDLLLNRSLVLPSRPGRYRLHPLLMNYAREQLAHQPAMQQESIGRSVDYFASYVHQRTRDYAAIDDEFGNISHALQQAQDQARGAVFNEFAQDLYHYFETRGLFGLASQLYEQAQMKARADADLEGEAQALYRLASIQLRLAKYETVIELCQRGLLIARPLGHDHLIYNLLNTIGSAYYGRGDFRTLTQYDQETLAVLRKLNDPSLLGRRLSGIGMTVFELGDVDQARAYLLEGRKLTLESGDIASACVACLNLGEIAMELGETQAALAWAEQGEALARSIGHRERLANLLGDLGHIKSVLGRVDEAESHFLEALALAEPMPWMRGFVGNFYHQHLLRTQRIEAAEAGCLKSLSLAQDIASDEILAGAQLCLAKVRLAQNRPDEARQLAEAALQSYEARQPVRVKAVRQWLQTSNLI